MKHNESRVTSDKLDLNFEAAENAHSASTLVTGVESKEA